jgi:hypothetical protein
LAKFSFGHPVRSLGNILKGIFKRPEPERPKPPPPPPKPPPLPPPSDLELDANRIAIWNEITGDYAQYPDDMRDAPEWWDLYLDTGAYLNRNYVQVNYFWGEFLRAFWLNSQEDGSIPREDFYDDAEIPPSLVDWERWRELKKTP